MTEIASGYWDSLYGDGKPKVVGPKDEYHEPYPGYWDKEAKRDLVVNTDKPASTVIAGTPTYVEGRSNLDNKIATVRQNVGPRDDILN